MMTNPRRFSLEDDFMKSKADDLVYGFMRSISTTRPITDEEKKDLENSSISDNIEVKHTEYLTFKKFQQEKQTIQKICGITAQGVTKRVNKLIECGLVEVGKIQVNGYEYDCYYFPYDYDGIYKIISQQMLKYLVASRNSQVLRIYLYLLNKSAIKADYVFTVREIKAALGYSPSTKSADSAIMIALVSLQKEGIIKYEKTWFEEVSNSGKVCPTERMVLKFIATDTKQF